MSNFTHPLAQNVDANGDVYSGAKLEFFEAGTSTPLTVYQDVDLTTAHADPVVADSAGVFPLIYLPNVSYRARCTQSDDTEIYDEDDLSPPLALGGDGGFIVGSSDLKGAQSGYLTVSTGDSGVSTPSGTADDLNVESAGDAGITIATPNTDAGSIAWADPQNSTAGVLSFDHSSNTFDMSVQSTSVLTVTATTVTFTQDVVMDETLSVTGLSTLSGGIKTDTITGETAATDLVLDAVTGQDVIIKTNGTETARVNSSGDVVAANNLRAGVVEHCRLEIDADPGDNNAFNQTDFTAKENDGTIYDSSDGIVKCGAGQWFHTLNIMTGAGNNCTVSIEYSDNSGSSWSELARVTTGGSTGMTNGTSVKDNPTATRWYRLKRPDALAPINTGNSNSSHWSVTRVG